MLIKNNKSSGFTLLELLVVIFIIAIISTLAYVSMENARARARDARRLADVYMIRQALGYYKEVEMSYPVSLPEPPQEFSGPSGKIYLSPMPSDPKTKLPYSYSLLTDDRYRLLFNLERSTHDYPAGENIIISLEE